MDKFLSCDYCCIYENLIQISFLFIRKLRKLTEDIFAAMIPNFWKKKVRMISQLWKFPRIRNLREKNTNIEGS